jgi:phage shock protein A
MSIATRFIRLWKADLHGVLESIEDKGLLLKQCLREMQDELESREAALNTLVKKKEKARQEQETLQQENSKVEKDLEAAVSMGKDDISRFLIKKRLLLSRHLQELANHIQSLEQDIMNGQEAVADRKAQYEQIQLRSSEFFRSAENKEWELVFSEIIPTTTFQEPSDEEVELELLKRKKNLEAKIKEVDHA